MFVLRAAMTDDADAVADVYLESRRLLVAFAPLAHTEGEVREWIRDKIIPSGHVTVAVVDRRVVGMLEASPDGDVGWIQQLYVHPDWIGNGVGSGMLEHAKAELGAPIRLFTFQENHRSRHFYEHRGFRVVSFGDGSDNEERCPDVLYEWVGEDR